MITSVEFTDEFPVENTSVVCSRDGDWLITSNKGKILVRETLTRNLHAVYEPKCQKISKILMLQDFPNLRQCQNVFLTTCLAAGVVDVWRVSEDEKDAHIAHFQLSLRKKPAPKTQTKSTSNTKQQPISKPLSPFSRIENLFWTPPQKDRFPNIIAILEYCVALAVLSISDCSVLFLTPPKYTFKG